MVEPLSNVLSEQKSVEHLLANINDLAIVLTPNFLIEYINPAAEHFFNWQLQGIVGLSCKQLTANHKHACHFLKTLPERISVFAFNENNVKLFIEDNIEWRVLSIPTAHYQPRNFIVIGKEKSKQENSLFDNAEFIYNMRHDTRTPVSCIIGLAKILRDQETSAEKKQWIDAIVETGESLMELINEILDVRTITSNNIQQSNIPCNLRTIGQKLITMLCATAKQKNILLIVHYDEKLPKILLGDRHRLQRVLLNLLSNAVKFTEKGYVRLSVDVEKDDIDKKVLKIMVEDTGIGIPKDKFEQVFEKFIRLESSFTGNIQGSGLGLAIVKQFVSEMGGKISVFSEENVGSKFICTIPFETVKESLIEMATKSMLENQEKILVTPKSQVERKVQSVKRQQKIFKGTRPHFLLVEDHNLAQIIAKKIITRLNCTVDAARNADEAIKLLKQNNYDIILMDIGLPDRNGIVLTDEIRKELKIKTPIIMLTAHILEENQEQIFAAGATLLHQKPITKQMVKALLDKFSLDDN